MPRSWLAACLVLASWIAPTFGSTALHAQTGSSIDGTVADAETGESLVGANVAILSPEGAVVGGTTTNADGRFSLRVVTFPVELAIRYIGYQTERVRVTDASPLQVVLRPEVGELAEVTVTPGENPADALMRRVIERTRTQRSTLGPYAVTAYARTTIRTPEREIRGIIEAASDAYWAPETGWREVVVARKRTGNLGSGGGGATAIADGLLDLLDEDVEVSGHTLIGPTHTDALRVYDFEIVGTQALDNQLVVEVALEPKRATASAFIGTLQVLFESADVLAADLAPGASFLLPPPIRITDTPLRQQYVPVAADSSLWLPTGLQSTYGFGIHVDALLFADPFFIERAAQFSDYRLGAIAPDSLLNGATVRRATQLDTTRLATPGVAVPLTEDETEAYAAGDSLGAIDEVLVLRGPMARPARGFIRVTSGASRPSDSTSAPPFFGFGFSPRFGVNPAEAARVGLGLDLRLGRSRIEPYADVRAADQGVSVGADARVPLARFRVGDRSPARLQLIGNVFDGVERRVAASADDVLGSLLSGPGGYYASRQVSGGLELAVSNLTAIRDGGFVQFDVEAEASLRFIAETASPFRPERLGDNLLEFEAERRRQTTRSIRLDAAIGTLDEPIALIPRRSLSVMAELAPTLFGSGDDYWRAEAVAQTRIVTFGRRRVLPAALDVRLSGGVAGGDVPVFRQFALEHAVGTGPVGFTAFGALRSRTDAPEAGDRYAMLAWEHSFRTIPFEILGLDGLTRRAYNVILHGAHARTWDGPFASTQTHHELGISLSGLVGGLRLDVTQRLDRPATVIGVGVARVF
ncbi:MAG: carboxypeptidase regulatory-like domain-containing protein [Bacteroidota bacterium]